MGGKNAIILDSDADLDEAVIYVLQSAFGYQGQKCSACSRLIVIEDIYDRFVERLDSSGAEPQHRTCRIPAEFHGGGHRIGRARQGAEVHRDR